MRPWFASLLLCASLSSPSVSRAGTTATPALKLDDIRHEHETYRAGPSGPELSLRHDLQRLAHTLLARAYPVVGAAVMVDVRTGQLLVFTSYARDQRPHLPLLTEAFAPAASLFKIVTTATLLKRSPVTPKTRVCYLEGRHAISRRHLEAPSIRHPDRLCAPFGEALGFSRNAVYAQLATHHLMRSDLVEVAESLGFNHELPFDAKAEVGTLEVPFNDLAFARTSAGFIGSRISVLGAAHVALTIARHGTTRRMTLLKQPPAADAERILSKPIARALRRMMEVTVHSGTSLDVFSTRKGASYLGSIRVAGKTGTLKPRPSAPTTSWFTGFAPSRRPRVVVTVLLQNAPVWRRKANEVARDLLRGYFAGHTGVNHPSEDW